MAVRRLPDLLFALDGQIVKVSPLPWGERAWARGPNIPYLLWFLTAVWAGVIFFVSSLTGSQVPSVMPDYIPHFAEYAVLATLVWLSVRATKKQLPPSLTGLWAICLTTIYAASDEFHQSFVSGRTPDVKDWAVDTLAALTLAAVLGYVTTRRSRK